MPTESKDFFSFVSFVFMPTESKDFLTNFANSLNPDQTLKMLDLIVCSFVFILDVQVNNVSVM